MADGDGGAEAEQQEAGGCKRSKASRHASLLSSEEL
jgi:hypothetical protein